MTVAGNPGADGADNPAQPTGTHGGAYPYQKDAPNAYQWTELAYDYLMDGRLAASIRSAGGISTATVTGSCPYCQDDVNFSEVLDAVTGESLGTLSRRGVRSLDADDGYVPLVVSCSCTRPHTGRPAAVSCGCGINFRVEVRRDA
jgi:hypothetical protein